MFDWDDEELANIIWGEAGENEDHIVPYPDETHGKPPGLHEQRSNGVEKEAANVKLTEKATDSVTDSQECSNINYDEHGKVSSNELGSLLDFSPSNPTKLDLELPGEKAQVNDGTQIFGNQPDDRDGSNFVDYSWANMGSFDDLDKILSNNDLVYGNASISKTETLWSSSKDAIDCHEKSELLSMDSPSLHLGDLKTDNRHGKTNDHLHHSMSSGVTSLFSLESGGGKIENQMKEKHAQVGERRKPQRYQTTAGEKSEVRQSQTSYDPWFSLGNQGKEFKGKQHGQLIKTSSSMHPVVPTLPQFHSGEEQMSPVSMTPQEKIEKLRKRQQMRALLAIRKQQQQFNDNSNILKSTHESQMMLTKTTFEDTILHQLESVISRLGIQIRLCIRDSLFRLAQSARQTQSVGDTVSTNASNSDETIVVTGEKLGSVKSSARAPDGETKTNPIDRAVAHLLFHTPPELSVELMQPLESSSGAKPPYETRGTSSNSPMEFLNKRYEKNQLSCLVGHENEPKSLCTDALENTSNNKTADGSGVEIEASSLTVTLL